MLGGMYLWALFGYDPTAGPIVVGASLSLPRAMRAAEASLGDPRGFIGAIEEVVLSMNVTGLDDHFTASGRRWLARRTRSGTVRWDYRYADLPSSPSGPDIEFFRPLVAAGRIPPVSP